MRSRKTLLSQLWCLERVEIWRRRRPFQPCSHFLTEGKQLPITSLHTSLVICSRLKGCGLHKCRWAAVCQQLTLTRVHLASGATAGVLSACVPHARSDPQRWFTCRFLPKDLAIIGYARSALDINDLRKKIKGFLKSKDDAKKEDFVQHITYVQGAYDKSEAFENLQSKLEEREQQSEGGPVGRLYYLALPPSVYPQVQHSDQPQCNCRCMRLIGMRQSF